MKILKRLFIILIAVIVIMVGGSYAAIMFVDKSFVEKQVTDALGRDFKINGEISPALSMSPSIKITDVSLANASWGSSPEMAKIGEVEVRLELLPLLSGNIEVGKVAISNAEIILERNKKWNFEFADSKEVAEDASETSSANVSIDEIDAKNVKITVKDGKSSTYQINELKLSSARPLSDLGLKMLLDGEAVNLTAKITPIKDILSSSKVDIKEMNVAAFGYKANGNLNADISKAKPFVQGKINVDGIDLSKGGEEKPAASGGELYSKAPLPFDAFSSFDGNIDVYVNSVKLNDKVSLSKITIPAKITGGILKVNGAQADFANSKINADVSVSNKASSLSLNANKLEVGQLFLGSDFTGGLTDFSTSLSASGNSVHALVNSLSGTTKMFLKDAVYSGEVKSGVLQDLYKLLAGGTTAKKTEVSCVTTKITWASGIGEVSDLGIISDYAVVTGGGKIKLPTQKIKMVMYPEAKNVGLTDLIVPPIAVSGEFSNLSVYPDPQGTTVSAIKTAAGIASGVGILAKAGELFADKTGISESVGLSSKNPCEAN